MKRNAPRTLASQLLERHDEIGPGEAGLKAYLTPFRRQLHLGELTMVLLLAELVQGERSGMSAAEAWLEGA